MTGARIYVDLDDVLAETGRAFVEVLAREFGRRVEFESIVDYDLGKSLDLSPSALAEFMKLAHRDEVLTSLSPMPGAVEAVQDWREKGYAVEVVTGRPSGTANVSRRWLETAGVAHDELTFVDKYAWPEEVFLESESVPLTELSKRDYCLAIEDSAEVAVRLAGLLDAPVVLLDRPWNRRRLEELAACDGKVVRCRDWQEIRQRFPSP